MKHEGGPHSRPRRRSIRTLPRGYHAPATARPTPPQAWTRAIFGLLAEARDELSDDEYRAFVMIVCDRVGNEAARLLLGEAARATRDVA